MSSSSLSSLFNRGLLGAKCKTCLNLAISRIKLLRNRREVQLAQMRKEISQFLATGQEAIARIRVEHVIREQNVLAAYEIIELFCEFVLARVPILDTQRTCPTELLEAISSIIFAGPRCSDVPELMHIRTLFTTKYGKDFATAASELRPDSGVNRVIIEKLSVKAPPGNIKLAVMKGIAQEYNIYWDSSATEVEFNKKHEDLLDGLDPTNATNSSQRIATSNPTSKVEEITSLPRHSERAQLQQDRQVASANSQANLTGMADDVSTHSSQDQEDRENGLSWGSGSDALEKARAAIASADRACAAARNAASLLRSRTQEAGVARPGA